MRRAVVFSIIAILLAIVMPAPLRVIAEPDATTTNRLPQLGGAGLFLLGANYVGGPDRSWTMWQDGLFNQGLIEQDFQRAKATGLNALRLFVRAPLNQEIEAGQWGKLDTVIGLAEKQGLNLIITLYDYREDDLGKAAALGGAIARRYASKRAVLAYDLKNEPHYQDLAIAQYPGSPPPLQTAALISIYGQRLSMEEVPAWRQSGGGKNLVPARFSTREAYIYGNSYLIYLEFMKNAGDWITARDYEVSILDYIESPDSAKWRPLLDVLDQTLAAWLQPQIDAIRAGDQGRLITVGYSDPVLARLSANNGLGAISIHRFPNVGFKALRITFDLLDDVRRAFPDKAVLFEEFGYSNDGTDPGLTALYETATLLRLMSQGMAGGAKWSLYDVAQGWDPRENNFGLYRTDGSAKPMTYVLRALGEYVRSSILPVGELSINAEASGSGLRYVYSAPDALFVAAPSYADPNGRFAFEASSTAQVFVSWARGNVINIASAVPAKIRINPRALLGISISGNLALQRSDGAPISFQRQGDVVAFTADAGQSYRLMIPSNAVDARIEIVWPLENKPVSEADRANIGAYLFQQGLSAAVCPDLTPQVRLWRALNSGVEEQIGTAQRQGTSAKGLAFSEWDFNGVDVSSAKDPSNKYYFRLSVDGYPSRSSIWSHGEDARTYLPLPDVPTGIMASAPQEVDAKIEVVWPHDNLPVDQATSVNISAYLFNHGTLDAVPATLTPTVRLWRALNNGYDEEVAKGIKVMKQVGELAYPTWEFDNVDVTAATDPLNKYYFRVTVDGIASRSNIWSHGADARTYFPQKDVPTGVNACN